MVPYADDNETPEEISRKFAALDALLNKRAKQKQKAERISKEQEESSTQQQQPSSESTKDTIQGSNEHQEQEINVTAEADSNETHSDKQNSPDDDGPLDTEALEKFQKMHGSKVTKTFDGPSSQNNHSTFGYPDWMKELDPAEAAYYYEMMLEEDYDYQFEDNDSDCEYVEGPMGYALFGTDDGHPDWQDNNDDILVSGSNGRPGKRSKKTQAETGSSSGTSKAMRTSHSGKGSSSSVDKIVRSLAGSSLSSSKTKVQVQVSRQANAPDQVSPRRTIYVLAAPTEADMAANPAHHGLTFSKPISTRL